MRILVAEDDPVSRAVLVKIISAQPEHKITVAEDGAIAWSLLDDPARSFDLVFLDLDMPKVDGFELLQRIRDAPLLKSLHVVLCTGSHDRATVIKVAQFGVKHYLVKPCTEAAVQGKLAQLQPPKTPGSERVLGGH